MVRIIMHGCNGKMGQVITRMAAEDKECEIVAGIDTCEGRLNGYPVFDSLQDCDVEADVVIDFSNAKAVDGLLENCKKRRLPVVLCTTGLSKEQIQKVEDAAKVLSPAGYDIEIVEKHHNKKVDAPSGTALALADAINETQDMKYAYCYDRSQERKPREKQEIGISAVRGGTIVGEHEVLFAGEDEVIEFKHTAYSKAVFAKGALEAAKFLAGKPAGKYDMSDVISF